MTDPFDDLEGQLRARVRARAEASGSGARVDGVDAASASVGSRRARSWGRGRGPLVILAALGLTASGAAVAATAIHSSRADQRRAGEILDGVTNGPHNLLTTACRRVPPRSTKDGIRYAPATVASAAALTAALPWMATPPTAAERALTRTWLAKYPLMISGRVVRGTLRAVDAGRGKVVVLYASIGGWGAPRDAAACHRALTRAVAPGLRGESAGVRQAVGELIGQWAAPPVVGQVFSIETTSPASPGGRVLGWGGGGMRVVGDPADPGYRIAYGIQSWGYSGTTAPSRYVGIAAPTATRIVIHAQRRSKYGLTPRSVAVRRGLWVADLPRGIGRVRMVEQAADGTVLRRMAVGGGRPMRTTR